MKMKTLLRLLLSKDKWIHFFAGNYIALFAGVFFANPLIGLIMAVIAGAAKELIWDKLLNKGMPEWWDFIYTAVGGFIGYLLFYSGY